jgi:large subunit ribosomal protein L21
MYAIVDYLGKQYKVEANQFIYTYRVEAEEGASIEMDQVLLIDDAGKVTVGAPTIPGAKVKGKVLSHLRDDKVIVFKKKRRKGFRKTQGHRQDLTKILVETISK